MAKITNRFVHFKTKASFTQRLGQGDIQESSVVFIQDANEIWTHGTYYKCNISRAEVEALITSKGYITEADIPSLTGGAAATSGQYVSGVTVSGHTVTVTKAALPSAATVAPKASGTADVGTSTKYAREDHVHPSQTTISGNAGTATKLATPRVIAIAGAVSGSATFDGSVNVSINSTLNSFDASKITSGTLNADRLPEIPISKIPAALPNPYALTINGTSYTGSSAVSINTARILSTATLSSSTVSAGYSYNNTSSRTISSLSGFSSSNPDSVIISTAKLTFTASNAIKMVGLADLSGTYYIYCLSYMANGKIAVNGAVYA